MKKLTTQKRMAAEILEAGINKVWFDPLRLSEIKQAITRQDIIDLIKDRAIKIKPGKKRPARKKRKRKGLGKTKMKVSERKRAYVHRIRKIRAYLKEQKSILSKETIREIRKLAKAGQLKNLKSVKEFIKSKKITAK